LDDARRKEQLEKNEAILKERRKGPSPTTLIGWKEMLGYIYSDSHLTMNISEICFHVFEEIGEVAQEIFLIENLNDPSKQADRIPKLEAELADVFSWMMALVIKIQMHFRMLHEFENNLHRIMSRRLEIEITDIIWSAYYDETKGRMVCYHCHECPCDCTDEHIL